MEAVLRNHILEDENFKYEKKNSNVYNRPKKTKYKGKEFKKKSQEYSTKKLHKKIALVLNVENLDTQQNIVK